jgi:AcrR family transcriptional regulator
VDDPVKSSRRRRNAAATRARVLAAAEALFVRDGYASTTITAIAEQADVAVQTVYAVFGNKRTVLTELLAWRVVGDEAPTPLRDRAEWREMEQEPDPHRQLMLLASIATGIGTRMAGLYGVLAGAAGSDPEIAELFRLQQQQRWQDQRRVARSLARRGALRPGLSPARATDILWALANPHTYRSLIGDRRWPTEDYERLLGLLLTSALLERPIGDDPPVRSRPRRRVT